MGRINKALTAAVTEADSSRNLTAVSANYGAHKIPQLHRGAAG